MKLFTKLLQKTLLVLALVWWANMAAAQSKAEQEVAKAVEFLREAMLSGNRADLEKIASDQLTYGHSSGALDDKKLFVEKIASGQSDFKTLEFRNNWISVSGNTAIVRHELHAETLDGGRPGEVHIRVMLVFQKQKGAWKLLGRQAVRMT